MFSPQSDLALYYRFGDDYVFVRVIYSNGILLRVKGNEHVEDSELKALMYTMGVAKRILAISSTSAQNCTSFCLM